VHSGERHDVAPLLQRHGRPPFGRQLKHLVVEVAVRPDLVAIGERLKESRTRLVAQRVLRNDRQIVHSPMYLDNLRARGVLRHAVPDRHVAARLQIDPQLHDSN
jgi:hypothetical protein